MRRPSDSNGAARDFESSNAMCARALGTSRKAWMSGNIQSSHSGRSDNAQVNKPTQPFGPGHGKVNPPSNSPAARSIPEQTRPTYSAAAEKDSPGSFVPSSLDIRDSGLPPKSPDVQNVLPSPAPSEEHRQENICVVDLESDPDGPVSITRPGSAAERTPRQSSSRESGAEPSILHAQQDQDTTTWGNNHQSSELISRDALRSSNENHGGSEDIRKRSQYSSTERAIDLSTNVHLPSTTRQSSIAPRNQECSSAVDDVANQRQSSTIAPPTVSNRPANSSPLAVSDSSMLELVVAGLDTTPNQFSQVIAQRLKLIQGHPGRLEVEVPRLTLLREAVEKKDIFYILLHQTYCRNFFSPMIESAAQFGFKADHSHGLTILRQLLLDNERLHIDAIEWFTRVPVPFEKMLQASRFTFLRVLEFLRKISLHWTALKHGSRLRNAPPSANEMAVTLGLHSVVLQGVLFRAVLREIWPGVQDRCFQVCESIFHRYQAMTPSQELFPENQAFNNEIKQLWAQHQKHVPDSVQQQCHIPYAQMPPPHTQTSHNRVPEAPAGRQTSYQLDSSQANSHNMPPRISTFTAQQASSIPPGNYTPTVPSSPSHASPMTLTNPSRIQREQLPSAQRPRTVAPLMTTFTPTYSPTTAIPNELLNSATTAAISPSWPAGVPAPPRLQIQNPHRRNSSGYPLVAQNRFVVPSQVVMPSQNTNRASSNRFTPRMNAQVTSPQAHPTSSNTRSFSTPRIQYPNPLAPSGLANIGTPFLHPFPTIPQATRATTSISAFHQSHVSSPTLNVINTKSPIQDQKYFTYIEKIQLSPERLHANKRHLKWILVLCRNDVDSLATSDQTSANHPSQLNVEVSSRLCRIRCIKVNDLATDFTESDWVATENTWPSGIAILLNGRALEIRKKLQHNKDLPINITSALIDGENNISIAVSNIDDGSIYMFAVETSMITDEETIKRQVTKLDSLEAKDRMLKHIVHQDPDVQVLERLTLDLTDPFTSNVCHLPVRGKACHHKQCFDLDIFLTTRSGKAGEPCGPDQFRCPICNADARPQSLFLDGFLLDVKEELEQRGRLDVKAIVLDDEGNWHIKEEERTGESGDGTGRRKSESAGTSAKAHPTRKETEIIDLDSDD